MAVEIVSWASGTGEQIAAILDEAYAGSIDLQEDAGWAVGDTRTITIGSYTDGAGTTHTQQSVNIIISSFDDYNDCGCVMQIDFECLADTGRMNDENVTYGGYGSCEMKTDTLVAIYNVLPSYIKDRLATFSVLASAGNGSSEIVTVPNNKLALRSEIEVFGEITYSYAGEGSQIDLYKDADYITKPNHEGTYPGWWLRSPLSTVAYCFVTPRGTSHPGYQATSSGGIAPFGCLKGKPVTDYKVTDAELTSVANAIRTKGGTSSLLTWPSGFVSAIDNISGKSSVLVAKIVTANKIYDPAEDNADGYSLFTVNVPQVISAGRCPRSEQTTGFQYGSLLSIMSWEGHAEKSNQ